MLDVDRVSDDVIADIMNSMDLDDCKDESYEQVKKLSALEAFDKFLEWNGIVGYTDDIIRVWENLKKAEKKKKRRKA